MIVRRFWPALLALSLGLGIFAQQGQYAANLLSGFVWRDVGPMRGGRTFGVAGHADQPDTFYIGSVGGGVWKTENSGRTWFPISDEGIPIGSIGAIAVAPSNANVVYVGTGEPDIRSQHSYGIGMFKSTDAGKTWRHIGLEATRQIGARGRRPDGCESGLRRRARARLHVRTRTAASTVRTDGGATWKKILFDAQRPNDVGAIDLAIDRRIPACMYAAMWSTRRPPWSVYAPSNLKAADCSSRRTAAIRGRSSLAGLPTTISWAKSVLRLRRAILIVSGPWWTISEAGFLPREDRKVGRPRCGLGTQRQATGGVYISDDAGATWKLVNGETRLGDAAGTSMGSRSIRQIPIAPMSSTPRHT